MQDQPGFRSSKEKLNFLDQYVEITDQVVLVLEPGGGIVFRNHSALSFFGWGEEELLNLESGNIQTNPSLVESLRENMNRLGRHEYGLGEFQVRRQNGTIGQIIFTAKLLQKKPRPLIILVGRDAERNELEQMLQTNDLLKQMDTFFGETFEDGEILTHLVQLVVPIISDWCGIHLIQDDGSPEREALAPAEILKSQAAYDWWHNDLPNDETDGLPAVFHSGDPKLISEVNPIRRSAEAGIKSYMIVPLKVDKKTIGAMTYVAAESGRHFTRYTLSLAENLTNHIAIQLERYRSHQERQQLKAELEKHINEHTNELSAAASQLKQSEEIIQTLFRVSNKLNATLDVELILDELAQEAINIVNGESGFAGLRTAEGMTVHKYFNQGVAIPFEHTWPLGEGIPGWVLKYKVPYGTSDAANDPLIRHDLAINANVRSIICTPILDTVGEVIGYFDIRNKQGAEGFTISDQEMLLTLAPVASVAIQNAMAYQQRLQTVNELKQSAIQLQELAAGLESAREEERENIARELHDQLGQALTTVKYDLAWLTENLEEKDETLVQKTKDIASQMNTMIKTIRRIATELRPGMLDDLGLAASIEWHARDFEKRTGILCELNLLNEELTLTHEQSLAMYRIFQEALTNIARYAEAKHVDITFSATSDLLTLIVHDDGKGIREEEISGLHSLGLLGMRERARHLGGTFEVQGVPDHGTTIKVAIPIKLSE